MGFLIRASFKFLAITLFFMNYICAANMDSPRQAVRFHEIIRQIEEEIYETFEIIPTASGGGVHERIERIYIGFSSPKELSVQEARVLLVQVADRFLAIINQQPDAEELLYRYPFLPEDITVQIGLSECPGQLQCYETLGDKLAMVMLCRGNVSYTKYQPLQVRMTTFFKEPFEEAARIVHQNNTDSTPQEK